MEKCNLTQEQKTEIRMAFHLFDNDGDGCIPVTDLTVVLRCLGYDFCEDELQEIIDSMDPNGSGVIDFADFQETLFKRMKEPDSDEELREAFRILDKDGNGFITAAELRHVMSNLCDKLTDEEVEEMVKEADLDGDGMINYEEFVTMIIGR